MHIGYQCISDLGSWLEDDHRFDGFSPGFIGYADHDYLAYRLASIRYVVARLVAAGVPVVRPAGGHAVFLDAARFLEHLPSSAFPGQALAGELYLEGGLRTCEIGSVMLGRSDARTGEFLPANQELVRLASPSSTTVKTGLVEGPCCSVGVQVITPLVSTVMPVGSSRSW